MRNLLFFNKLARKIAVEDIRDSNFSIVIKNFNREYLEIIFKIKGQSSNGQNHKNVLGYALS